MTAAPTEGVDELRRERWILLALAAIQFTHICDFVLMMPLGPQFMRVFEIGPSKFGLLVSSYTFSAAVFGLLSAFVVDRFDRKRVLLCLYSGFVVGTLLCGLARTYELLLVGRVIAGGFGGTAAGVLFAVLGDVVPAKRRGAATGTLMASFSAASVFGVPFGLLLANEFGWPTPFYLLALLGIPVLIVASRLLPPVRDHLDGRRLEPWRDMRAVWTDRNHLRAFALVITMMFAGFSVIPFLSPYLVSTVGYPEARLPLVYFFGGLCTIFTARYIGRLADRHGHQNVFRAIAFLSLIPIVAVTHLPRVPMGVALMVTTVFIIFVSGRMVPVMAMITLSANPKHRGSFMSVSSAVQQLATSVAAFVAGLIVRKAPTGEIERFSWVGALAVLLTFAAMAIAGRLKLASYVAPAPRAKVS